MNNNNNDNNINDNNIYDINIDNIDLYELFNIEYNDVIFDLYDDINEYSNSCYINFNNKGNIGNFVNMIYNNIDVENSSVILDNMRKNIIKEKELDVNEYNDIYYDDDYNIY